MTIYTPSGIPVDINDPEVEKTLAHLWASVYELVMRSGDPSAAAAIAPLLREAGPTVAAAEGSNRRAAVHATTALNGAVQPLSVGANLSAPYDSSIARVGVLSANEMSQK